MLPRPTFILTRRVGQRMLLISTSAILAACSATMATYYFLFPPIPSTFIIGNYTNETDLLKNLQPSNISDITLPDIPPCGSALFYIPLVNFGLFFFALGA